VSRTRNELITALKDFFKEYNFMLYQAIKLDNHTKIFDSVDTDATRRLCMKKILFRRKVTTIIAALLLVGLVLPTATFAQRAPANAAPQQRHEPARQERERQERERQERERQERERQERERQERERRERPRPGAGSAKVVGNGLTITGLSKYNGYYVVARGETTGRGNGSYIALGSLAGGGQTARISGGRVDLLVLEGRNIFAFEGNDTVKFTLSIQRDEEMSSRRYVAVGEVTVTFRKGKATGTVTRITEVGRK
jgi:hypothetical protein